MKNTLTIIISILISWHGYSQVQAINQNDVDNTEALLEAYISPLTISFGTALNNGWYNTAKPHKLGGFDVTLTANFVIVPEEAKTFNIDSEGGSTFDGGNTPTILGDGQGASVKSYGDDFKMPEGLNISMIPLPILQAGIGIIKGTEINFRYIPDTEIGEAGKIGLFGIGLKHDILQWTPIDVVPIDLAIQAGFSRVNSEIMIDDPNLKVKAEPAEANLSSATVNLILSKKLLMFTPYLGVGYNSTKTKFKIDGKYYIGGVEGLVDTELEFARQNNFRTNIGFRLNLAIIALQANYTFSEYPVATIGVGISIR